jgi:hypothetical protein
MGAYVTYLYEQLGAERFQQFSQALLISEYPDLQCFPVGQPDGGRDALSRAGGVRGDGQTVVQVKFRRSDEAPSADWMISALKGELPKITKLIKGGAQRYIMVTNAASTAHPSVGRIDLVQAWLDKHVGIPSEVFWRDEIDRRLDANASLKLSYPSLLTGNDALTLIIEAQMGPTRERLARTVRSFVSEQFRKDEEVKFRQVDLTSSLLDLFVDVPVNLSELMWTESRRGSGLLREALHELTAERDSHEYESVDGDQFMYGRSLANTADFLLDERTQKHLPWVVLQGAPGQGKSTLAQYVCQVHRARLLGKTDFVQEFRISHADSPFRLPFKVDLRDFAAYLDGQPYLNSPNPDVDRTRSLERFLASLVSIQSGGRDFSPDDFAQTASSSPLLFFLDGLDEVADLKLRRNVIDAISHGLNRLKDDNVDIQVVVTTRPSLFGRKPALGRAFTRLELAPIDSGTISAYAEKWMVARKLDDDRSREVRGILRQKLDQAHIRELTRNPMQLAILLNLILSIGHSLPDARTSLYSEYVKLFMTREAEKSEVVRRHRAVISGIVEHLAWLLQAGAETDKGSGSMDETALRTEVESYLARGQLDTSIVDEIFTDGIERVWVLVQRVEGLFEFEVQPLREYFAAEHLYSSAPVLDYRHANHGGDRSERFEAIAANPYWANVTRFYAGFYQPGEIAAIASSLKESGSAGELAGRIIARNVAVELLADWIFNLKKPIQNEVLDLAFDRLGMTLASIRFGAYEGLELPVDCGQAKLAEILAHQITSNDARESLGRLPHLLRLNGGKAWTASFENWIRAAEGKERTRRLRFAMQAHVISDGEAALDLATRDQPGYADRWNRTRMFCFMGAPLLESSTKLRDFVLDEVLELGGFRTQAEQVMAAIADALASKSVAGPHFRSRFDVPFPTGLGVKVDSFLEYYMQQYRPGAPGNDEVANLSLLVERAREAFGDRWAVLRLAAINSGSFAMGQATEAASRALDSDLPLMERAISARSYRGPSAWWQDRIKASDPTEAMYWLTILLCWAPAKHVEDNLQVIREAVAGMKSDDRTCLVAAVRDGARAREERGIKKRVIVNAADLDHPLTALLLVLAFGNHQLDLLSTEMKDSSDLRLYVDEVELRQKWSKFPGWKGLKARQISEWTQSMKELNALSGHPGPRYLARARAGAMPAAVARTLVSEPDEYPIDVVLNAFQSILSRHTPEPVGEVARRQEWVLG